MNFVVRTEDENCYSFWVDKKSMIGLMGESEIIIYPDAYTHQKDYSIHTWKLNNPTSYYNSDTKDVMGPDGKTFISYKGPKGGNYVIITINEKEGYFSSGILNGYIICSNHSELNYILMGK